MAYRNIVGSKFEATKDLELSAVAALVRADIKAAVAAGKLPEAKYSVRAGRSTHTRALGVAIWDVRRPGFVLMNPHRLRWDLDNPHAGLCGAPAHVLSRFSQAALDVLIVLEEIVAAYNFDKSEPESDYWNERFHGSIDFAPDYVDRSRDAELFAMAMTDDQERRRAVNDTTTNAQEAFLTSIGAL